MHSAQQNCGLDAEVSSLFIYEIQPSIGTPIMETMENMHTQGDPTALLSLPMNRYGIVLFLTMDHAVEHKYITLGIFVQVFMQQVPHIQVA